MLKSHVETESRTTVFNQDLKDIHAFVMIMGLVISLLVRIRIKVRLSEEKNERMKGECEANPMSEVGKGKEEEARLMRSA
jgi:hypothetical protein